MTGATTTAMAYTENAWPRFSGANVSAKIACSVGASPPPPRPCRTRKKTSTGRLGARPHISELTPNSTTHVM